MNKITNSLEYRKNFLVIIFIFLVFALLSAQETKPFIVEFDTLDFHDQNLIIVEVKVWENINSKYSKLVFYKVEPIENLDSLNQVKNQLGKQAQIFIDNQILEAQNGTTN